MSDGVPPSNLLGTPARGELCGMARTSEKFLTRVKGVCFHSGRKGSREKERPPSEQGRAVRAVSSQEGGSSCFFMIANQRTGRKPDRIPAGSAPGLFRPG